MAFKEIQQAIKNQGLPADFINTVNRWYQPIAADTAALKSKQSGTLVLGIQGCQGSGKSTLASFLHIILTHKYQLNTVVLSIDDFYLTRKERTTRAKEVHPLLATRGVPGTHDVDLALSIIDQLKLQSSQQSTTIPRFDKSLDDRSPKNTWDKVSGNIDIIIFEGWCVGVKAEPIENLKAPINALEKTEDQRLIWRTFVNNQLKNQYSNLFSQLSYLLVIGAPSFECVYEWRVLQEKKLKKFMPKAHTKNFIMSNKEIRRFISHFERLTKHCLNTLPEKATWTLEIDSNHKFTQLKNNLRL